MHSQRFKFHAMHSRTGGFTLVELVTTIILIGVLAVVAIPRLIPSSSYSAYSLRNEFMAELRKAQLLAMNNTDICIRIEVDPANGYRQLRFPARVGNLCSGAASLTLSWQPFQGGSRLRMAGAGSFQLDFDALGRLPATGCNGACIAVIADETLTLAVESEGYIHAL
ncbi:Tfp pilus assembly protein FimT/FimU [Shewanella sp.]|uniref:pilus assembly FimT family protein n=1 Tax=Shewanella sp. TaxID=50422 RepID=UPI003568E7C4